MTNVRVKAVEIIARDLNPGDLFSIAGPAYWDRCMDADGIGERVFVRTNLPCRSEHDSETLLYRLTIEPIAGN